MCKMHPKFANLFCAFEMNENHTFQNLYGFNVILFQLNKMRHKLNLFNQK